MKINKLILIIFIILAVFSLSTVNASNMNVTQADNLSSDNGHYESVLSENPTDVYVDSVVGYDSNNGTSQYSSIKTISKALMIANDNDTIYLADGEYSGLKNTRLTIDKSVNFIGSKNTVINGEDKNYIFNISDNVKVTFQNIKFVNAFKSPLSYSNTYTGKVYGAVLSINDANVIVDNCSFINSRLDSDYEDVYGGAISNFGDLTITNSYFGNNNPVPSSQFLSHGGCIFNKGSLSISDTVMDGSSSTDGAGVYNEGTVNMRNCIISNSSSRNTGKGAAIFNNGNFTLFDSIIENNYIDQTSDIVRGSVYNNGMLTVRGSIFRFNNAKYESNRNYKGSSSIYNNGILNLTYNAFIDNLVFKGITGDIYNSGKIISIDNNWWGSNDNPGDDSSRGSIKSYLNTWLIFTLTPEYSMLNLSESVNITALWTTNLNEMPQINLFPLFNTTFKTSYGETSTEELQNGRSIFVFDHSQNKGQYTVTANIGKFTQEATVDVGKILTQLDVESNNNIVYNETLKVNITVKDVNNHTVTGRVSVKYGKDTYNLDLINGKANLEINDLKPGNYTLKVTYDGNENYFKSFYNKTITIEKQSVNLSLNVSEVKIGQAGEAIVTVHTKGVQGQARLYVDGELIKNIYLYNGNTSIPLKGFADGSYNITVQFVETDRYLSTCASAIFKVSLYDSSINITANDIGVGENATITITVDPDDLRGEATLVINGYNETIYLNNITTNITLSNLKAGKYNVSVYYDGYSKYYPANASTSFSVLKMQSELNVTVNQNGTIIVKTNPSNCTGVVTVFINFNQYNATLVNGEARIDVEFDKGTNYIFINYEGDDYYSDSNWNTTMGSVDKFVFIGRNSTGWNYNDFDYAIRLTEESGVPLPKEIVIVEFDGNQYKITTNDNGLAYFTLNLPAGKYNISARYGNVTIYNTLTVRDIEFNITSANITYEEVEIVETAFDSGIKGKVTFIIDGILNQTVDIVNNKAICNISGLNVGNYDVKAIYSNNMTSKEASSNFNVDKATLKLNVTVKDATSSGDEIIYVFNLSNATGKIIFNVNGREYTSEINNSESCLNLSKLSIGTYSLKVQYDGDKNYHNYSYSTEFNIKEFSSKVILNVNEAAYGEDLIATATLNSNATGIVRFSTENFTEDIEIINGVASWTFTGINAGNHNITATYLGDNYYISSNNSTSYAVLKAQSKIVVYADDVVLNENIRIFANLSTNATGNVLFSMNGYYSPRSKVITNSVSKWYISPLKTGNYTIIAVYDGDDNYYGSNTTYILKVTQVRSLLSVEINDASLNDRVRANIDLKSSDGVKINGKVILKVNSNRYTVLVENGKATFVLGTLAVGNYTFEASYDGNANYSKSYSKGQFEVKDTLLDVNLIVKNVSKYYKGSKKLVVSLQSSKGKAIVGETIIAKINGKEYSDITDSSGKVSFDIDFNSGNYIAEITFKETKTYHAASAKASIIINPTVEAIDVVKLYGSGTQYFAIFSDSNGRFLGNTEVKFKIGTTSTTVTTLPNGVARLNINIRVGTYSIVATNPVTGEKATNKLFIFNYLMENQDLTKYYKGSQGYKVRAYGNDGNPVGAGQVVKIKVNGKTYSVKTDKNGYATLKINLKPGKYTITATYNKYTVTNKIKVKSTLITKNISKKKSKKIKYKAKLLNSKGKPLKGKKITFKFKGKKYKAKTNKKGIATITIKASKLKVGKYKIYTSYGKLKMKNTIRIKK
ncbi:Ig-like domain repeat protein [Methanobrevibacter sp.]|uniref:Ig-like domain repeat protein n=1 Tax=Methanobrevibacter sp. TaxID=66852 RepID=UPI0038670F92